LHLAKKGNVDDFEAAALKLFDCDVPWDDVAIAVAKYPLILHHVLSQIQSSNDYVLEDVEFFQDIIDEIKNEDDSLKKNIIMICKSFYMGDHWEDIRY
jgi:hypothetical protein